MSQALPVGRFLVWGRSSATTAGRATVAVRDARIDVVRGLALLVIFINHMPGNILAGVMPHNYGFSDAADVFVLLAGVSAVLAYGTIIEKRGFSTGLSRLAARMVSLYAAHVAVLLIVCGIVAAAVTRTQNPLYIEAINIQPLFENTLPALLDALTLRYQPFYLDILPLYIVLLACFPAIYWGVRISPAATLLASAALWQGAVAYGLNLPNAGSAGWFFNPFAWQFLFALGVVIGRSTQLGVTAPRLRSVDALALGYLGLAVAVKVSSGNPFGIAALNEWIDTVQLGTDKTNLAWVRVAHVAAMAWLVIRYVPAGATLLGVPGGRLLSAIGRHSLAVFCAGIVLSISGQIILAETSFAVVPQLLVCGIGVIVLACLGIFLSWYQSVTLRGAPGQPSPGPSASALQS